MTDKPTAAALEAAMKLMNDGLDMSPKSFPAHCEIIALAFDAFAAQPSADGLAEQAVMVCPQCEGEGSYADGLDEAACTTQCTRCGGNGWIVDLAALRTRQPEYGRIHTYSSRSGGQPLEDTRRVALIEAYRNIMSYLEWTIGPESPGFHPTMRSAVGACRNHRNHRNDGGAVMPDTPDHFRWRIGDLVRKKQGSSWRGKVCGWYSTDHTPEGYDIESHYEPGSVQCWPLAALEDWIGPLAGIEFSSSSVPKERDL